MARMRENLMTRSLIPWILVLAGAVVIMPAPSATAQESAGISWRKDYSAARKEAEAKNLPIFIDFVTTNCFFCKKMDSETFSNVRVAEIINSRFIPLKIHESDERDLVGKLGVDKFPTTVIAAPDGMIMEKKVGYVDASQLQELMLQKLAALTPTDIATEKYKSAEKHMAAGEFTRAISSLRDILEDGKPRPIHKNASELLRKIERLADERLARAKDMMEKGQKGEALEAFADIIRIFAGLPVSRSASDMMVSYGKTMPQELSNQRNKRARDLLLQAQEFYKTKDYVPCLDRCGLILKEFGDLPEGTQAHVLAGEIKNNQEWLQSAADAMTDHLGGLWLALADSDLKHGEVRRAQQYLQRVITAFPGSRMAESAQIRLNQLQGTVPAQITVPQNGMPQNAVGSRQ